MLNRWARLCPRGPPSSESQGSCSVSFCVSLCSCSWMELKVTLGPVETRKLLFCSYIITYILFLLAKTDAENCKSYLHVQTDSGRFVFCFCGQQGRRRESYLPVPRLYKELWQKLGYKCLITPCIYTRDKAISFVCCCRHENCQITRSRDSKYNKPVETGEKLASLCFESLGKVHECHKYCEIC